MISYIKGHVLSKGVDYIITLAGGIGYKVHVAEKFLSSVIKGAEAEVYCRLCIRQDDTLELYGVDSQEKLDLFELLIGISGIGPKAALLLSSLGTKAQLEQAVKTQDAKFFAGVKGIGPKRLQKIMLELTGSFNRFARPVSEQDDAEDALVAMGFSRQTAKDALSRVDSSVQDIQARVKAALKLLRG